MKSPITILSIICLFVISIFSTSCGGGTTGTGGSSSTEFKGLLISETAAPVGGASVTIAESGDSATTDSNGKWSIETDFDEPTATLLIESDEIQATTQIKDLPAGPKEVELTIKVDKKKKNVEVTEKKVQPKKVKPTPTPTNFGTPAPTSTPNMVPTPGPTEIPATPTATYTPTLTTTPTPTVLPTETATATPTATVTPARETVFDGRVQSTNPSLLGGKVKVQGLPGGRLMKSDGTFSFKMPASDSNASLQYVLGTRRANASVDAINAQTGHVSLVLQVEENASGRLQLFVISYTVEPFS